MVWLLIYFINVCIDVCIDVCIYVCHVCGLNTIYKHTFNTHNVHVRQIVSFFVFLLLFPPNENRNKKCNEKCHRRLNHIKWGRIAFIQLKLKQMQKTDTI